ncbi:MAG: glycosyltransferase [Eubacteriales bacterium]|jgi:glycosyltransferase involved in cell wall biosynthesis
MDNVIIIPEKKSQRGIRIAILTSYLYQQLKEFDGEDRVIFGGAEKYMIEFCRMLHKDGHFVQVFQPFRDGYIDNKGNTKPTYPVQREFYGIPVACMPTKGNWDYSTNPDVNYTFNEMTASFDLRVYFTTFMAWPEVRRPAISISHGIFWDSPCHAVRGFAAQQKEEFFRRQLYGFTAPDVCVAVDTNVRGVIAALSPGDEYRIRVIPNFVDTTVYKPTDRPENVRPKVLYPRRLSAVRGINDFTWLAAQFPDVDFLVCGNGADRNQEEIFSQSTKGQPNVKTFWRKPEEMYEVYQECDVAIIPTRASEGTSLSMLEAMATGLPIIGTPAGGLPNLLIDNWNGLVVDLNHESLAEALGFLLSQPEAMRRFGQRNREMACECFDLEIWKLKWRNILAEVVGGRIEQCFKMQQEEIKNKPKLTAMMIVKNETNRYLEEVIANTLYFCEEIVILDDHSTDNTVEIIDKLQKEYPGRIRLSHARATWDNEGELRQELLDFALMANPDWLIAIDADELYESGMVEEVQRIISQDKAVWVGFRFYDMWNKESYRDDDIWPAGAIYAPRMFRVEKGIEYKIRERNRHCGSIPVLPEGAYGTHSNIRVKHFGWARPEDRERKYYERVAEDPNSSMFPRKVYEAILDSSPTLVKWDDNNPWQTSKKVIVYPPDMHWGIMRQRPHHLMRLAASEGNRVFFGDDKAPDMIEALPYLTLVRDWEGCNYIKDVDVLYITNPKQLDYCKGIKFKKLIYDCCDWRENTDAFLLRHADYVLCASKLIYKKIRKVIKEKAIYVPNACDFEHFSKAGKPETEIDIVGYMGCLHPVMVDENILGALADKFNIALIGENKGLQINRDAIVATGHMDYSKLPELIKNCKVGIIPFRTDSEYLRKSAPIKVYEYMAAGRPVVASPIPELLPLGEKGLIHIVANNDLKGWVDAVEQAMTEYPNTAGQEYARGQTWEARWEVVKGVLGWT